LAILISEILIGLSYLEIFDNYNIKYYTQSDIYNFFIKFRESFNKNSIFDFLITMIDFVPDNRPTI